MAELFKTSAKLVQADGSSVDDFDLWAKAEGADKIAFTVKHSGGQTSLRVFKLAASHGLTAGAFSYDGLTETKRLKIDLSAAGARAQFEEMGLAGLNFKSGATLESVEIVLRKRPEGGSWTAQSPCFEIMACWKLDVSAKGGSRMQFPDGAGDLAVDASAEIRLCAGFSAILPDMPKIGLPNFQIRLDLPDLGLTSEWGPLSWFEFGDLSGLQFNGLLRWFGDLTDFDWTGFDFEVPDWDVDLPLSIDLPLGAGAHEISMRLIKDGGALAVTALARDFYVTWKDSAPIELGGRVSLSYAANVYTLETALLEKQYPTEAGEDPFEFSLPFDVMGMRADVWYMRLGLFAANRPVASGDPVGHVCFEFLLEVGGLQITSSFSDDEDGLYRTDLRLLLREFNVMTNDLPAGAHKFLSGAKWESGGPNPFAEYQTVDVPALSFAADLLAEPPADPANDYGLQFLDGDFRVGERIFVLWRQTGLRFLRALAHDLLGRSPAGKQGEDEASTLFGLEIAQFGAETQIRLDWRAEDATTFPLPTATGGAPVPVTEGCIKFGDLTDGAFNLPLTGKGVDLRNRPADPMQLELPAIRLDVAQPDTQSVILAHDAIGKSSVAHLLHFPGNAGGTPVAGPVAALARADIDFSLMGDGKREVMKTDGEDSGGNPVSEPFLSAALGYGGGGKTALRTIGWQKGETPRFLQVLKTGAQPVEPLIPTNANLAALGAGDIPTPPAPAQIAFDAFETPRFGNDTWRVSVRLAAAKALFAMVGDSNPNQDVRFSITKICEDPEGDPSVALIRTELSFAVGAGSEKFEANGEVTFRFDLGDLSLSIVDGAELSVARKVEEKTPGWAMDAPIPNGHKAYHYTKETDLLGLKMTVLSTKQKEQDVPKSIDILTLGMRDGRFVLSLPENRHIALRYTGLGDNSLNFWVSEFVVGPGGVDLEAKLLASTMRVQGLKRPFALKKAGLRIRSGQLDYLMVEASGVLPELLDEAPVSVTMTFKQDEPGGSIDLDALTCELGDKKKELFSRGTRFKFVIKTLDLKYTRDADDNDRHFFFEITGSAQFTPDPGEFDGGLLEDLKSAKLEFIKTPLTDEFHKSISLSVELKEPITFDVFSLFKMEIRSLGFHPSFDEFGEPGPALVIGGQCEFADLGDVVSAEIDFHAMYIGMPKSGEVLPQVHFDGLRVDISSPEGFRIAGRVDRYDEPLIKGFAGEGTIQIPGFPELSAAFSFVRLRKLETDSWKRGWFVAIEAAKISYQMGPLPIYLRQIGLGFGYRYTLPLIKEFEEPGLSLGDLIRRMLKALDEHQTLARIDSWVPDAEREGESALWTIALEAVFTVASANSSPFKYNPKKEKKLKTLIAQIIASFRSDFTLVSAAKVWYPVSVDDFFHDNESMRKRPLASGFMIYSAPQSRFLAHAAKGKNPYLGPKDEPVPDSVKNILQNSHFEATLLIEPGLLHAELGWPDRLMFRFQIGSLVIECRGGVLFRLEHDVLIQGVFFSARGSMDMGGGVDFGFTGVRIEAHVSVHFAVRLLTALYLSRPLESKIYAALGLDVAVRFVVRAWLRLKIGFCKINISISFALNLQIVVALELGWAGQGDIGFRGRARVSIGVFGRSLGVSIAVGINEGGVNRAREALRPYMGSLLEPGAAPAMPGIDQVGASNRERIRVDEGVEDAIVLEESAAPSPAAAMAAPPTGAAAPSPIARFALPKNLQLEIDAAQAEDLGDVLQDPKTDDFVSTFVEGDARKGDEKLYFVWIMPGPNGRSFYPAPLDDTFAVKAEKYAEVTLPTSDGVYKLQDGAWVEASETSQSPFTMDMNIRPNASVALEAENGDSAQLALQQLLAGCWYPKNPADYTHNDAPFPEFWPLKGGIDLKLPPPESDGKVGISDPRVLDNDDMARSPRRRLDPENAYDQALARVLEAADPVDDGAESQLRDQALGNQSFLLQGFYDDLVWLASDTAIDANGDLSAPQMQTDRPSILDLGMVYCVKAKTPPAWIADREAQAVKVEFTARAGSEHDVLPAIDFKRLDFTVEPPVFRNTNSYFDDEVLGLVWQLGWSGTSPKIANGADQDLEAYVQAYDIQFIDLETQKPLKSILTKPTDLLAPATAESGAMRLRSRFQFSAPVAEIFDPRERGTLTVRRIGATVTPISQSGHRGASFTFTLEQEPQLTPLPADGSELMLTLAEEDMPKAELSWRQPSLPAAAGVAKTDRWHLILRPLAHVPLGAWPEDAIDTTDRGLMSATGQALIEGDIIVELNEDLLKTIGKQPTPEQAKAAAKDGLDPAEMIYTLRISPAVPGNVFDHLGRYQADGSAYYNMAKGFFEGQSATQKSGHSWRVFLRAARIFGTAPSGGALNAASVSGLAQVRLGLTWQNEREEDADIPIHRPLPYFEWPDTAHREPSGDEQLDSQDVIATAGPLHVPFIDPEKAEAEGEYVDFSLLPGRSRGVSLTWNALPSDPAKATQTIEGIAAFDLYEVSLDNLLNFDLGNEGDFRPNWRRMRRIIASDLEQVRQSPASMSDVQIWQAQYPVFARSVQALTAQKVAAEDMKDAWPGWYSWAESDLLWPLPPKDDLAKFNDDDASLSDVWDAALTDDAAPLEVLADPDRLATDRVAAWRELGRSNAKQSVHPFLEVLVGRVAEQSGQGAEARFEVQVIAGQPTHITKPDTWLLSNTEVLDPYGWAALSHLGLNMTLALRDPITGLLLPQSEVLHEIDRAIEHLRGTTGEIDATNAETRGLAARVTRQMARLTAEKAALERALENVPDDFPGLKKHLQSELAAKQALVDLAPASVVAAKAFVEDIDELARHLSLGLPIQHAQAYRASGDKVLLDDIALTMTQIDLRPIPASSVNSGVWFEYDILTVSKTPSDDLPPKAINYDAELIYLNSERPNLTLSQDGNTPSLILANMLRENDVILVREKLVREKLQEGSDRLRGVLSDFVHEYPMVTDDPRKRPAPILDPTTKANPLHSPFERFGVDEAFWVGVPAVGGKPRNHGALDKGAGYSRFLRYLTHAFALSKDMDESGADASPKDVLADLQLIESLQSTYLAWANRFFATMPLGGFRLGAKDPLAVRADYTATAQPKTSDPLRLGIDGNGRLTFTRFVEEELASARSYAIRPVGRYERLWNSVNAPGLDISEIEKPPELGPDKGRADVSLPRVRKLDPPQALGARVVRSTQGRPFNELTLAHSEKELKDNNITVARKLEFGDIQRAYQREFRFSAWLEQLQAAYPGTAGGEGSQIKARMPKSAHDPDTPERTVHDFGQHTSNLLATAPEARWNSGGYVDAAEPFYYRQTAYFFATAADLRSRIKNVVMPSDDPDPLRPIHPDPVSTAGLSWKQFGDADKQAIWDDWTEGLAQDDARRDRMRPVGVSLDIRLPRLIENLTKTSRDTYFKAETQAGTVGHLPDPNVRTLVLTSDGSSVETLAQILPRTGSDSPPPGAGAVQPAFETQALSEQFVVKGDPPEIRPLADAGHLTAEEEQDLRWSQGLFVPMTIHPTFAAQFSASLPTLPDLHEITARRELDAEDVLSPTELPTSGPLADLEALAIRLRPKTESGTALVTMHSPMEGPRWVVRPHLSRTSPENGTKHSQTDLMVGIRLSLDTNRLTAAAMAAWDVGNPGSNVASARRVLAQCETRELVALLGKVDLSSLDQDGIDRHRSLSIQMWWREQVGATSFVWHEVTESLTETAWTILTSDRLSDNETIDVLANVAGGFGRPDIDPDQIVRVRTLNEKCLDLAEQAYRPTTFKMPDVFVQRGNERRVPWRLEEEQQ